MITKEKKQQIIADLVEKLERAQGMYLVNYSGVTAMESIAMRRQFKEIGGEFKVAKNTLMMEALKQVESFDMPEENFVGQNALVLGYDDPVGPGRLLKKIIQKEKKLEFRGAVIEGQLFNDSQLETVASLPTREDMIAAIIGSIGAPASGIVGSVAAVMRDLASLVEEVAKKQHGDS